MTYLHAPCIPIWQRNDYSRNTVCNMHVDKLTGLPLISHRMSAAGFEFEEVQFTSTMSPMEYLNLAPFMIGLSVGKTAKKKKKDKKIRFEKRPNLKKNPAKVSSLHT